jgi:hypothetical protein
LVANLAIAGLSDSLVIAYSRCSDVNKTFTRSTRSLSNTTFQQKFGDRSSQLHSCDRKSKAHISLPAGARSALRQLLRAFLLYHKLLNTGAAVCGS